MNQWLALSTALDRTMANHVPDWTDHNDSDPGITLLEVMAYLAEQLQYNAPIGERGAAAVSRIMRALERIPVRCEGTIHLETGVIVNEQWSGAVRPRFFTGRMLTADDLNKEQEYHREVHRRHLQTLHGFGIVQGLEVEGATDDSTIVVRPGVALDPCGHEIFVDDMVTLKIPSDSPSPAWVVVQYAERLVGPVPVLSESGTEPSRIEEGCQILLSAEHCESGIALARLIGQDDEWRVDPSFVPARLRTRDERS